MTPIDRDLGRILDGYQAPPLPADFAARVTARALAATRTSSPPLRRSGRGRWSRGNRIVIGLIAGSMLSATAAAAAGLFGDVGITVPALKAIVERVTSPAPVVKIDPRPKAAARDASASTDPAAALPAAGAAVPITPEQLEARFKTVDERRAARRERIGEQLRNVVDQRIEQRKAAGLPVPTDAERAAARARIEQRIAERDAVTSTRRELLRNRLREAVNQSQQATATGAEGSAPSAPAAAVDADTAPAIGRALTPEERAALRQLREGQPASTPEGQ